MVNRISFFFCVLIFCLFFPQASSLDQTLSLPIEVKNIHYVLATLDAPSVKFKNTQQKFPCGMNIFLKITLHDNLGNKFAHNFEYENTLKHKLSSKEIADIHIGGNFTIGVRKTNLFFCFSLSFDFLI